MPLSLVIRVSFWSLRLNTYTSRFPSFWDRVSANLRPSGDHAGALLIPAREETRFRSPVRRTCVYTAEALLSKDTYARFCPSGDHAGDIKGSVDCATTRGFSPSASATIS